MGDSDDRQMTFRRSDIIQYLGRYGLPPWRDEHGNMLGGGVDCAALGSELVEALDAIELRGADVRPRLGCATTRELLDELVARIAVQRAVDGELYVLDLGYRTVGFEPVPVVG